jgi:hypothetical protein
MPRSTYRCLDHEFSIDCDEPALEARIRHLLAGWRDPGRAEGDHLGPARSYASYAVRIEDSDAGPWYEVVDDCERIAVGPDFEACFHHLLRHLTLASESSAPGRLFIHAGAVATPDGGAVLLPGASGSGKTTLTAALLQAGCSLLSDEVAVLRLATGEVEPFTRPLAFEADATGVLPGLPPTGNDGPILLTVDDLGGTVAPPSAVRAVVAPVRVVTPHCEHLPLTPGQTLLALAEAASDLTRHGERGLSALAAVARAAPGTRLAHGSGVEAVALVLGASRTTASRPHERGCPRSPVALPRAEALPGATHVPRRADGLVEEHLGDETVVLDGEGRVHLLDPTAAAIWRAIDGCSPAPIGSSRVLDALTAAGLLPIS